MSPLPSSVENYLKEAGFTSTELLVLKKLLEEDALTLRELAAKTGKSTGVLDQALKKLLRRNIVMRESVNDTAKYRLISLEAIAKWMEEDTRQKQEMLKRRHQNFEAFLRSVQTEHDRPEMQFFDGDAGISTAYEKLLGQTKELLHYFPVTTTAEEDPLREFRVKYFRDRRNAGVFSRYIVHNTPLGRRFASRDPFEYRKTMLVPEHKVPITFEKVIAGDTIACFNHVEKKVCFVRYRDLAQVERDLFERIWEEQEHGVAGPVPAASVPSVPEVPLSTRTLSALREFFLSKKSLAIMGGFILAAALVTFGLYRQNYNLNLQRLRERAMSIAATGAMQFDYRDLDKLRTIEDIKKPEYAKVIRKMNEIRDLNESVAYAWILRPSDKANYWEFVADADSIDPYAKFDVNADGVVDENDQLQYPGQFYDQIDNYLDVEMKDTYSVPEIYSDQWGTYLSSSSPIRDASGISVAIFGVDIFVKEVSLLTWQSFNYIFCFVGLFLIFVLVRLAAFNKSLFSELWQVFKMRKVLLWLALAAEIAFFVTLGFYFYTLNIIKEEYGQKLMAVAATAASQFDTDDLDQLHLPRDMKKEAYQRVFNKLNDIRDTNTDVNIKWAYILRSSPEKYTWEFVADADANDNLPFWTDGNVDGIQTIDESICPPGTQNYQEFATIGNKELALSKPLVDDTDPDSDQWGAILSASAPIADHSGNHVAIIGLDADYSEMYKAHRERFVFTFWFIGIFFALVLFGLLASKISGSVHKSS